MAKIHDLRSFLEALDENGRLLTVNKEVGLVHEIGSVIATAESESGKGVLFKNVSGSPYSLAGGMLSLLVMYLLKRTDKFSMIGVSMAGGVAHNLGQLTVAALIVENAKMYVYFSVLLFSGIFFGIMIGIIAYIIEKKLPRSIFR